jgi:hypothetical protein
VPYLVAHPAAVVPLRAYLGRFGVLSALVLGSVAPDLWCLAPQLVSRDETHRAAALLWFCLPVGLVAYYVFHLLLKQPLLALLPPSIAARLPRTSAAPLAAVVVSILVGAVSHLAWDAFTHADGYAVNLISLLQAHVLSTRQYELHVYTLLQHLSTLLGLALLAGWIARWWRSAPAVALGMSVSLTHCARVWIAAALLVVPSAVALWLAASALFSPLEVSTLRLLVRDAAFAGLRTFLAGLMVYSLLWQALDAIGAAAGGVRR